MQSACLLESWRTSVVTNEPNKQQWLPAVSIFFSGEFCRVLPPGRGKKFHRIAGSRFLLAIQRVRKIAAHLSRKSMMSSSLEGELWVHLLLIFWQIEWLPKWVEFVWSNKIQRWEKVSNCYSVYLAFKMHLSRLGRGLTLGICWHLLQTLTAGRWDRFCTFAVGSPGKEPRDLECTVVVEKEKISMEKFTMNPTGIPSSKCEDRGTIDIVA